MYLPCGIDTSRCARLRVEKSLGELVVAMSAIAIRPVLLVGLDVVMDVLRFPGEPVGMSIDA